MILWYRFPVILEQQNITTCGDPTVLIIETTVFHGMKTHSLADRCKYNRTCRIYTVHWTQRFIWNVCINQPYYTFSHRKGCNPKLKSNLEHKINSFRMQDCKLLDKCSI